MLISVFSQMLFPALMPKAAALKSEHAKEPGPPSSEIFISQSWFS